MAEDEGTEPDYTPYKDKEATQLHKEFAAWVVEKTGYDPAAAKSKAQAYLDGIRLGATLRMSHQASPENQASIARRKEEALARQTERAAAKPEPKPKKAVDGEATAEKPAPARRPNKAAKAAPPAEAPVTAAAKPRRRPVKATAGAAEAPF